jgi:UDP-galactopyranose mutase
MMNSHRNISDEKIGNFATASARPDLVCLSHLRWDFVYQRPQHLLSRFAKERRVFFVEEPTFDDGPLRLDISERDCGVSVVVPRLPKNLEGSDEVEATQRNMINQLFAEHQISEPVLWYYTPMAMPWTRHLQAAATVYDCMDELSAFKGAPRALKDREAELFKRSDLVFTGGQSLYEVKRDQHRSVYAFPSSIDAAHFAQARCVVDEPMDQAEIPHPRLGFFGVIDERMDIELLDAVAQARPDWHLVMIGPVVKIDPADLPRRENIHYLGGKSYTELPSYLAGWDVALLPFARNESTRFISPTKTPEYLAAGCAVVSTSIRDVVRPYGDEGLVHIADTPEEYVEAIEAAMSEDATGRLLKADAFLAQTSWDQTWGRMAELIEDVITSRRRASTRSVRPALASSAAHAGASTYSFVTGD